MDQRRFAETVARVEDRHPTWFDLQRDEPLDPNQRVELEDTLGLRLPDDYVWFLCEYGGGEFAFAMIFSADSASDLFILQNQEPSLAGRAVAFSEDGTGNQFVFPVVNGIAEDRVLIFDHEIGDLRQSEGGGFLDFVHRVGLRGED